MEELRFDGRVALVTGAGRGMGKSHARLLAARGARVVVNDLGTAVEGGGSSSEPASQVSAEIEAAGGTAIPNYDDISTERGSRALVEAAVEAFGRLDIVVNNAAIINRAPFAETTPENFDTTMKVNAYGPFYVMRAAWPHLVEQQYGRIVLVSSAAGLYGFADRAAYATSKAAVVGLARTLAAEGADFGIRVNALNPGALTRMTSKAVRDAMATTTALPTDPTELEAFMQRSSNLVSPVVAWLAHESCDLNGEIIHAGRGRIFRSIIATTAGFAHEDITIEDVRDHLPEIMSEENYRIPGRWSPHEAVTGEGPS